MSETQEFHSFNLEGQVGEVFSGRVKPELTQEEIEKNDLLAVGPFAEDGGIHMTLEGRPNLSEQEGKALDFVQSYVANFIIEENQTRLKQIQDWPKMHVSNITPHDDECDVKLVDGWGSYGKYLAFRGDGLAKAYEAYKYTVPVKEDQITIERFSELFQPMVPAICGLVFTADNKILFTKRHPEKVSTYGQSWHVPGGYLEANDKNDNDELDPFVAMRRELEEEIGLTNEHIQSLTCVGIARDPKNEANVSFLFVGRTTLKGTDIVDRAATGYDRLRLNPKDIDGDVRPKALIRELADGGKTTKILPALLRIDQIFGIQKRVNPGPELTVPSSKSLVFLVGKMMEQYK